MEKIIIKLKIKKIQKNKTKPHLNRSYCVFAVYLFSLEGFPNSSERDTGGKRDLLWEWLPREILRIQAELFLSHFALLCFAANCVFYKLKICCKLHRASLSRHRLSKNICSLHICVILVTPCNSSDLFIVTAFASVICDR